MDEVNANPAVCNRETILGMIGKAPRTRMVTLGDGSGEVRISVMSGEDRDRFERLYNEAKGVNVRAILLCFSIVDDEGKRVFEEKDIPLLAKTPSDITYPVFKASWKLNRLGEEEVREDEKN